MPRSALSASQRWSVFSRDGFSCRYCGSQAGENGVTLAVDHVLSVKDGGDDRMDNLVTACQLCNGGKGARSLMDAPAAQDALDRLKARRDRLVAMRAMIEQTIEAQSDLEQGVVNLKCRAYRRKRVNMANGEQAVAQRLLMEFGADRLLEWYELASAKRVVDFRAIEYVCGCARKTRERSEEAVR